MNQPLEHVALGGEEAGELDGVVELLIENSIVPIQFSGQAGAGFCLIKIENVWLC